MCPIWKSQRRKIVARRLPGVRSSKQQQNTIVQFRQRWQLWQPTVLPPIHHRNYQPHGSAHHFKYHTIDNCIFHPLAVNHESRAETQPVRAPCWCHRKYIILYRQNTEPGPLLSMPAFANRSKYVRPVHLPKRSPCHRSSYLEPLDQRKIWSEGQLYLYRR